MGDDRKGRTLVTGASAGIGAEIARVFGREGHDLVLVARRESQLQALKEEIEKAHGVAVTVHAADLGVPGAPGELAARLADDGLDVDILVNNAGILFDGPFHEIELEEHLSLVQVNIAALVAMSHLFLGPMRERGYGRIVNIASTSAFQPVPGLACYAASKSFVLSLTESMSVELKGSGVTMTAICPGFTATDMVKKMEDDQWGGVANALAMKPSQVAEETYRACMKGRPVHVNGPLNKVAATFVQHQPRWLVRSIVGYMTRK